MTQDDIVAMAKRAGLVQVLEEFPYDNAGQTIMAQVTSMPPIEQLTAFAKLVAEKERSTLGAGLLPTITVVDPILNLEDIKWV